MPGVWRTRGARRRHDAPGGPDLPPCAGYCLAYITPWKLKIGHNHLTFDNLGSRRWFMAQMKAYDHTVHVQALIFSKNRNIPHCEHTCSQLTLECRPLIVCHSYHN